MIVKFDKKVEKVVDTLKDHLDLENRADVFTMGLGIFKAVLDSPPDHRLVIIDKDGDVKKEIMWWGE